jgi:hypothetical protein
MLGIRILARIPAEAEYAEDYTIVWSYEGPNLLETLEAVLPSLEFDDMYDYSLQIKKMECGAYVWKTVDLSELDIKNFL